MLQQPAYTRYYPELGEISSYPPGYKENAGIFCHNNPWIMIAEALLDRGERAYDYYRRIAPAFLEEFQEIHRAEPYVYAQMIAGPDAAHCGQAKNSWLTGTAAWNYVAICHYMLGIRPEHEGLRVAPAIVRQIGPYRVTRRCRGAEYVIDVGCADRRSRTGPVRRRQAACRRGCPVRAAWRTCGGRVHRTRLLEHFHFECSGRPTLARSR